MVAMPWYSLFYPQLATAQLAALARSHSHQAVDYPAYVDFANYLQSKDSALGPAVYQLISDDAGFLFLLGEWVFADTAYQRPVRGSDFIAEQCSNSGIDFSAIDAVRTHVPGWIDHAAERTLSYDPAMVGLSAVFMGVLASTALARRIRQLAPDTLLALGGAGVEGAMGVTWHKAHPEFDYIVTGEGESTLLGLLDDRGQRNPAVLSQLPHLSWVDPSGQMTHNQSAHITAATDLPDPDFERYFSELTQSLTSVVEPRILLESGRGCWWGAKSQCTFCGLNPDTMPYRSSPWERTHRLIRDNVTAHQVLEVHFADNILAPHAASTLLPALASDDVDLDMFYEVKSNLRTSDVAALAAAGVWQIQPGVENLSSHVLALMRKGISGAGNVRMLRDCNEYGVTPLWNYLYGFPLETDEDYDAVIAQIPNMYHLQPPGGPPSRVRLERFSPHFDDPSFGLHPRVAGESYWHVFDLDAEAMDDFAYFFDTADFGIRGAVVDRLTVALQAWREAFETSHLSHTEHDGLFTVRDTRVGRDPVTHYLDAEESRVYALMDRPRKLVAIARAAQMQLDEVSTIATTLRDAGLVYIDEDQWMRLSTRYTYTPKRPATKQSTRKALTG